MNATAARIATPVEVLARLDTHKREPVMFLRSTIDAKGNVTVWRNGAEERSTVDFYGTTAPLNAKDEKIMVKRFADAYGITPEDVHLNKRLPRTPRDRKSILRELATPQPAQQATANATPATATPIPGVDSETLKALLAAFPGLQAVLLQAHAAAAPAAAPAPAEQPAATNGTAPALTLVHDANAQQAATPAAQPEQAAAAQPAAQQTEQAAPANNSKPRRMTKAQKKAARSEAAKKAAQTRAANRAGNAKSLDAQPMPEGPQGDLPKPGETPAPMPQGVDKLATPAAPIVDATPDQVAARIAAIREQMNAQIDDVLKALTPHEPATQK